MWMSISNPITLQGWTITTWLPILTASPQSSPLSAFTWNLTKLTTTSFWKAPWFLACVAPLREFYFYTGQSQENMDGTRLEVLEPTNCLCENKRRILFVQNVSFGLRQKAGRYGVTSFPWEEGRRRRVNTHPQEWKRLAGIEGNFGYYLSNGVRNTDWKSKPYEFFKIL